MDRKAFFDAARKTVFGGSITPEQLLHSEALLEAIEQSKWPLAWAAYGLATAFWETDRFTSLIERGGDAYFKRMYDPYGERPKLARSMGNVNAGDGARYRGRGYVHLTWLINYAKASRMLGIDLVSNPELARRPDIAASVMFTGMRDGWFTGKGLGDYLKARQKPDYLNARRIINGMDKAGTIAGIARNFEAALVASGYGAQKPATPVKPVTTPTPAPTPVHPQPASPVAPMGFWSRFRAALQKRLSA